MPILRNKLPPNMRTGVWNDFIDVIEEESLLAQEIITEKRNSYNIDLMSYERLLDIANLLGVPFDVSVDSSEDFLREEVRSVPFRIKWKATMRLYKSFFQAVNRTGVVYIYYYNGSTLVRHSRNILLNINGIDPSKPYTHVSWENFTGFLAVQNNLDTGLKLDEGWKIDNLTSKQNTKHLAFEFVLDRIFFGDEAGLAPSLQLAPSPSLAPQTRRRYLMDAKYFSYLETNLNVSKKATEVMHIGCQLTTIMDNSRFFNSYGLEYTMPDLFLNAVTVDGMTSVSTVADIYYMVFGIGTRNLPSTLGGGTQPTELVEKLAKIPILTDEQWEDSSWYGVSATYMGNLVNDKVVGTGDGVTTSFTATLPYAPIKRGNVKIYFYSGLIRYTLEDDRLGSFVGTNGEGTINYTTGEVTISTDIFYPDTEVLGVGTGSETHFVVQLPIDKRPMQAGSVMIKYVIGGSTYVAEDDGSGVISGGSGGSLCTGTVNYVTAEIDITFATAPVLSTEVHMRYKYKKVTIPTDGLDITTEYYFTSESVNITEAGVTDVNGNLLAYTTFPRIQFTTFNNHLSMGFIIKKSDF